MNKVTRNVFYWFGVLVVGVILGTTLKFATAWIEPSDGSNIVAPLNSSSIGQSKLGGLILNVGSSLYGLIVQNGLVGIGTTAPNEKLTVEGNIGLKEGAVSPSTSSGYTKLYSKKIGSDPAQLYYKNGDGEEIPVGNNQSSGNLNVNGDAYANNFYVKNTGNSLTQNGLCLRGDCRGNWPSLVTVNVYSFNAGYGLAYEWAGCPTGYQIVSAALNRTGNNPWEHHNCYIEGNGVTAETAGINCYTECVGLCVRDAW